MRKRTLFFVLFLLSLSRAQQSSTKAPWDSLEFFVGNWQGTFQGEPGHGTGEQHYQFVLQDKFLQATNKSVYPQQEKNPKGEVHEDLGLSYDGKRKKFVLRQFHVEGFVNEYVEQEITADGKTLRFVTERIENIPDGWRGRETYKILNHSGGFGEKLVDLRVVEGAVLAYSTSSSRPLLSPAIRLSPYTATTTKDNSMTENGNGARCHSECSNLRKISVSEDWFEVYEIASNLFAFCETRHYENTTVSLLIGPEKAALIDTGCGIGNLRKVVAEVTDKPVIVVNTHTHLDHLGSNHQFDEIAMFDHPSSRRVPAEGASRQIMQTEILAENLVTKPWPQDFDPSGFALPPFKVNHWLRDGDRLDFGGPDLEVIYTPGEAADHICLVDRADRILFCGDILLHGPVWTHLEGGSLKDLLTSYRRLMSYFDEFDHLMPGHNQPWLDKGLLPETLAGAEKVLSGQAEPEDIIDPWNRRLKQYSFGRFAITTRQ